ncbi:hypothetical protein [Leptolyngbya sp. PCC 6406]|uniref:hypothetical protein n=1 Tax=Leptolyngbya sp. PCC 6406 TaxID=1173264 RepID=UPI0002ACBC1A|nr:hypothetical protein [Leptolyngbya sp. PCC 6406]
MSPLTWTSTPASEVSQRQGWNFPSIGNPRLDSVHAPTFQDLPLNHHRADLAKSCPSVVPIPIEAACYLIKLTTHNQEPLFGHLVDGCFQLNALGQVAADEWLRSPQGKRGIELDCWDISSDQLQGIVIIREPIGNKGYGSPVSNKPRLLSSFVAGYKAAAAKRINLIRNHPGSSVWQRSYQERLLPDQTVLQRVRQMLSHPAAS